LQTQQTRKSKEMMSVNKLIESLGRIFASEEERKLYDAATKIQRAYRAFVQFKKYKKIVDAKHKWKVFFYFFWHSHLNKKKVRESGGLIICFYFCCC
jgi:hypothetical protein